MKTPKRGSKKVACSHPQHLQPRGILKRQTRLKAKKKVRFNPKPHVCLSDLQFLGPCKHKSSVSRSVSATAVRPAIAVAHLDQPSTSTSCLHTSLIHKAGPRLRPFLPRKTKLARTLCLKHPKETGSAGTTFKPHCLPACSIGMSQAGQDTSAHAQHMDVSVTECDQLSTELNNLDLSLWENSNNNLDLSPQGNSNNNAGHYDHDTVVTSHPATDVTRVDDRMWCPVLHCCCVFPDAGMLQRHLSQMNHSPCNPLREAQGDDEIPEVMTFVCPQCGDVFNNEAACAEHMVLSRHLATMAPLPVSHHACPACLLMFPTWSRAAVHMHSTGHFYSCLGFEDDQATRITVPIPVPARTSLEITRRCSRETFTVTCSGCNTNVAEPGDLARHLDRGCMVAASCMATVRDVVVAMVTDQACAGCRQFIIGRPEVIYGVHLGCPGQGYIMPMAARSLAEFLRRCGIASVADVLEETLDNEQNDTKLNGTKPNKTCRRNNEKGIRCYDTIEASAAFDKAIDDMFDKYHTDSMTPVFSGAASCSSSYLTTGCDVNKLDMTSSFRKPATCLTQDLSFLECIDMIDNQIYLLSCDPFGETIKSTVDTGDASSQSRSISIVTDNIGQADFLKTKEVVFRDQGSRNKDNLRKTKQLNRKRTLKCNKRSSKHTFNKIWKTRLNNHQHLKGARWTKLIQNQLKRKSKLHNPQISKTETSVFTACSNKKIDHPNTYFNVQDCFVLLKKLDMRKDATTENVIIQPSVVSRHKCFESNQNNMFYDNTETNQALENNETDTCIDCTEPNQCLDGTKPYQCRDNAETNLSVENKEIVDYFDFSETVQCLEAREADTSYERTEMEQCFQNKEIDHYSDRTETIICFDYTETEQVLASKTSKHTTMDQCLENNENNLCLDCTDTISCFDCTVMGQCFTNIETDTCFKKADRYQCFENTEMEPTELDNRETEETNHCESNELGPCKIKEMSHYGGNETSHRGLTETSQCESIEMSHCESKETGHCENKETINCENIDLNHCENKETNHCANKDTNNCENKDTIHCENKDTNHCEKKETSHCEQKETNNCENKDTNHNESKDTNHCKSKETNHNESKETNHNESKETNHNGSKETNPNESKDTNHCDCKDTNHCENKDTNHNESKDTNQCESKDTNPCAVSKNDCFLGRRHRRISTAHSFLTLREGLRTKTREVSKQDGYYRALNSTSISATRDRNVHRRLGTKM